MNMGKKVLSKFYCMNFSERVYKVCRRIPKGKVSTYKEIAKALNSKAYRAVGSALNKNQHSAWGWVGGKDCCRRQHDLVPCHRVVNSDGSIGGFASGTKKKILLLKKEGIEVKKNKVVDFDKLLKRF